VAEKRLWPCVVDTNVLIYNASERPEQETEREEAKHALEKLLAHGHPLYTVPIILIEFWRVARREVNGLDLPASETREFLDEIKSFSRCLLETPNVLTEWYSLLDTHDLPSAQVYDAYIAAFLRTHPILQEQQDERGTLYPRLLTFKRQ
jgi:predicted nucleic acid-binding protein